MEYQSLFRTVQERGQLTLPKIVRESSGIAPGDRVAFRVIGLGRVLLESVHLMELDEIFDAYSGAPIVDVEQFRRDAAVAEGEALINRLRNGDE